MFKARFFIPALFLLMAGCASKSSSNTADNEQSKNDEHHQENGHEENGHHDEKGDHEASVVPEVDDFHTVLGPLWHEKAPAKDWDAVCKASHDLEAKAEAIVYSKSQDKLGARLQDFKTSATRLGTLSTDLVTVCTNKGDVEAALKAIHEEFHNLMKLSHS